MLVIAEPVFDLHFLVAVVVLAEATIEINFVHLKRVVLSSLLLLLRHSLFPLVLLDLLLERAVREVDERGTIVVVVDVCLDSLWRFFGVFRTLGRLDIFDWRLVLFRA